MKSLGLTPAMRAALEKWPPASAAMRFRAYNAGLAQVKGGLMPRGHSALAAPKMTRKEYEMLARCADPNTDWCVSLKRGELSTLKRLWVKGWQYNGKVTPSGSKALNDMRAAEGSPDYKEST